MRTTVLFYAFTFLCYSCSDVRQDQVTDTLNQGVLSTRDSATSVIPLKTDTIPNNSFDKMTMVSGGQMAPYSTINFNGCDFILVTREKETIYLSTRDENFKHLKVSGLEQNFPNYRKRYKLT